MENKCDKALVNINFSPPKTFIKSAIRLNFNSTFFPSNLPSLQILVSSRIAEDWRRADGKSKGWERPLARETAASRRARPAQDS